MTYSEKRKPQLSEADIAFELLLAYGRPRNYHDLIVEVLTRLDLPTDARSISAVLTQINLDTRFVYTKQGEWGLKAWIPGRNSKKQPAVTMLNNSFASEEENDGDRKYEDKWGQV